MACFSIQSVKVSLRCSRQDVLPDDVQAHDIYIYNYSPNYE